MDYKRIRFTNKTVGRPKKNWVKYRKNEKFIILFLQNKHML